MSNDASLASVAGDRFRSGRILFDVDFDDGCVGDEEQNEEEP